MTHIEGLPDDTQVTHQWDYEAPKSEFTELGDIQWGEACYNFDLTRVWAHNPTGRLYAADDNGCSCPSPFENVTVADLTPITRPQDFYDYVDRRFANGESWNTDDRTDPASVDQMHNLVKAITAHFEAQK